LREKLKDIDLKLIHVIRNPYDNISTMKLRSGESLPESIQRYFSMCEIVERLKPQVTPGAVYDLRHEALIDNPKNTLKDLCGFLSLSAGEDYYTDCAGIIFKSSHKTRTDVEWNPELINSVRERMDKFPFLAGYGYDDSR
jgi:hypothetical protein